MIILTAYNRRHEKYLNTCNTWKVHLFKSDDGKGKAYAMNQMLKLVKDDEMVGFLDADDIALPGMFTDNTADFNYGDSLHLHKNGHIETIKSQRFSSWEFEEKNFIPYSGVVVRGSLLKGIEYPDIYHGNDWLFWHKVLQRTGDANYTKTPRALRRTWTSYKRCRIPIIRKIKRKNNDKKVKQLIYEIRTT